jgi:CRP-like cAMP-binding protein/Fe-S-cluster-containing hydrogenase component 2
MPISPEPVASPFIRDDDEGLFSRDINGQLVRLDPPTESDYGKTITLQIDGQTITVSKAEPLKDANGNLVQDLEGRTTPRYTTIYDAALRLYVRQPGDEAKIPIPTLCHLPHMKPAAVCRLCVVQIYGQKRGKRAAERKLLPACQHQVKEGMEVFTMNAPGADGDRVRQTVKVMTELLAVNHLKPAEPPSLEKELAPFNELGQMVRRCAADPVRLSLDVLSNPPPAAPPSAGRRELDASSPVFRVDHNACILCDRCVRACDEVQENHVIGRTGKGVTAGIGFDLNDPMGSSTCVQCGECMVSCPTSAITFNPGTRINLPAGDRSRQVLSPADLISDPVFAGISPKFLLWQQGLVIRRHLKAGDVLCRQGEAGNSAYVIKSGKLEVTVHVGAIHPAKGRPAAIGRRDPETRVLRFERTPADVIVGEMSCLSGTPRNATVTALEDGEVWEVRRNVLDRLMRLPSHRQRFETDYRKRALEIALQRADLFENLAEEEYRQIVSYLRPRLAFLRVSPGQTIFRQGDRANDLYLVRLGHVRVGIWRHQQEARTLSIGPGAILGEIGLLALSPQDVHLTADEVENAIKTAFDRAGSDLTNAIPAGLRTATCSALDHLELVRVSRADFLEMVHKFPNLRRRLVEQALARLRENQAMNPLLREYVDQGLYEGRSLLVLDLDLCTRCDECTRGCVEQHGTESHGVPVTRLFRDGRRFENFLIGTACRSCADPHCMLGCPVDSIHRGKHLQIVIEDHCIGCGLCASNCPYGNIFMLPNQRRRIEAPDPENPARTVKVAQPKAATCDLCDAHGKLAAPQPRCVSACPHDAAFRMTGEDLLHRVMDRASQKR